MTRTSLAYPYIPETTLSAQGMPCKLHKRKHRWRKVRCAIYPYGKPNFCGKSKFTEIAWLLGYGKDIILNADDFLEAHKKGSFQTMLKQRTSGTVAFAFFFFGALYLCARSTRIRRSNSFETGAQRNRN